MEIGLRKFVFDDDEIKRNKVMGITQADAIAADEEQLKKDPFLILGSGLIALRYSLRVFTVSFMILTILALPIIHIYHNG